MKTITVTNEDGKFEFCENDAIGQHLQKGETKMKKTATYLSIAIFIVLLSAIVFGQSARTTTSVKDTTVTVQIDSVQSSVNKSTVTTSKTANTDVRTNREQQREIRDIYDIPATTETVLGAIGLLALCVGLLMLIN